MPELQDAVERVLPSVIERVKRDQTPDGIRSIVCDAENGLGSWVRWPNRALLLWDGCVRLPDKLRDEWVEYGKRGAWKYVYPRELASYVQATGVTPDRRMNNGPPQTAFRLAGGECPIGWEHHHI